MSELNTASALIKILFCIIMMTCVVLDSEEKFIQAPFNEVCNWAQKFSSQTVGAISSEQHFDRIAILTKVIIIRIG